MAAGEADVRQRADGWDAPGGDRRHHYGGVRGDAVKLPTVPEAAADPRPNTCMPRGTNPVGHLGAPAPGIRSGYQRAPGTEPAGRGNNRAGAVHARIVACSNRIVGVRRPD